MAKTDEEIVKNVLKECANLEEVLNGVFLPEFIKLHRASPKYNQLKLKQELVASKSAFFTKKKYGLYVINKEGKTVSEYEAKGMIMRKSNFPAFSKEKISKLLDMILKEEKINLPKIKTFIEDTEKEAMELCRAGSKLVAGAVSFSKDIEDYKQIPTQILGMELWNRFEYPYFIHGTKGYLFRILGVDTMTAPDRVLSQLGTMTNKNKNIVIPFEEDSLPPYYILDLSLQLKFVWTDRVKEVIGAISENKVSTFDELFE